MYAAAPVLSSLPAESRNSMRVEVTLLPRRSTLAWALKRGPVAGRR